MVKFYRFFSDDLKLVKALTILLSLFRLFQSLAPLYEKHFWPYAVFRKGKGRRTL